MIDAGNRIGSPELMKNVKQAQVWWIWFFLIFRHLWRETVKLTNLRLSIFTPMTLILMNFTVVTFLIVHIHCLEKRIYLNVSLNLFC